MKIVFVSNYINHYQITISDELFRLSNGDYYFIETARLPESFVKNSGFIEFDRNYIIRAWQSKDEKKKAIALAKDADVVIGSNGKGNIPYVKKRLMQNKLTFDCSERALKKGWINMLSPANVIKQSYYHLFFYKKPYYKLCASAYAANDMYLMHSFKGRCYKYGYFPKIDDFNIDSSLIEKVKRQHIKIIWCARFIAWKHPELAIVLGLELKKRGYDFEINMIGKGVMWDEINASIKNEGLSDHIHLLGAIANSDVLKLMRDHDIFLFTSDRNEGWGVVLNESMGQGCCPVASNLIGATPFLLEHKKNGMIFKSEDIKSMIDSVIFLIDNPDERVAMSKAAYQQVRDVWCPEVAASRLYELMKSHLVGPPVLFEDGPLSPAVPY